MYYFIILVYCNSNEVYFRTGIHTFSDNIKDAMAYKSDEAYSIFLDLVKNNTSYSIHYELWAV